jgi:hypothetical protein
MLADYYGAASYGDALKGTAKVGAGIALGSAAYVIGAIPGHAALSSLSPRNASLAYAAIMGLGSVWYAQRFARGHMAMAGAATVFVESVYTAIAAVAQTQALPTLPAGPVAGLFDLDNKQAIAALTRLPLL